MKVLDKNIQPEYQMQNEIISYCRDALEFGKSKIDAIESLEDWQLNKTHYQQIIKNAFPNEMFDRKNHLNTRSVSKFIFDDYRIENVIFESLPGWEVNATIYLPKEDGKYPGIICPTGHSTKTRENYQRSAQTFARNGYIAISFDPPGVAGEKQYMNDHFTNGLIGYLTGYWSQTHFVIDALRAIDYLETRDDVDSSKGFAMTGVSGGGLTTIFCAMLDKRISACAPVCCISKHEVIHLQDLYTSCPEQFGLGYLESGIDYEDYMFIIAPTPCLIVAGLQDEVFDYRETTCVYEKTKEIYSRYNSDDIGLYIDEDSGHAYTVKMTNQVVRFFNRFLKSKDASVNQLKESDIVYAKPEQLMCYPSEDVNMFTINRDMAIKLREKREKGNAVSNLDENVYNVLGLTKGNLSPQDTIENDSALRWKHLIQNLDIVVSDDIHIPAISLRRNDGKKRPLVIFLDEQGKWKGLKHQGFLARTAGFLQDERDNEPAILSCDVTGLGELSPQPTTYDLAYWNDIERILTYLSLGVNKPIMGLRVRDTLSILEYAQAHPLVDNENIIIAGRGIGAIVALHAAYLWGKAKKVVCIDMLARYEELTESFPFTWKQSVVIPQILKYYDLPDLVDSLNNVTIFNPRDAKRETISQKKAQQIYKSAIINGANVICDLSKDDWQDEFYKVIYD